MQTRGHGSYAPEPREMAEIDDGFSPRHHDDEEDEVPGSPTILEAKENLQAHQQEAFIRGIDSDDDHPAAPKGCFGRVVDVLVGLLHKVIPPGGILSSAFSLASGSIGAGILGLPGATDTAGLVMAVMYLVIITFFSVFSMHLLASTTVKTNIKTFEGLGRWLFPRWHFAFSYWVALVRWFYSFGACVGYVISVGDCLNPIFRGARERYPDNKAFEFFSSTNGLRLLQSLVWLFIMLPLVVPKHIDSLRYASTFAVTMMTYFVTVIIVHSAINGFPLNRGNVKVSGRRDKGSEGADVFLFRTGNDAMTALGVFMFAYVCQINALEVFLDMRPELRTPRNFTYAATIGMLICGTLYLLVCVFGYFDFGAAKLQDKSILLMYKPLDEPYMMVAYVGVLIKLCVSYALLSMASRNAVYYVIGWQQKYRNPVKRRSNVPSDYLPGDSFDANPTLSSGSNQYNGHTNDEQKNSGEKGGANKGPVKDTLFVDNIPMWRHLTVVGILAVICLMCGLFIPTIKIVFSFAGSISGGFMAFILPALFYMYSGDFALKKVGTFMYFTTYALLISGVIGVVFGMGSSFYSIIGGK